MCLGNKGEMGGEKKASAKQWPPLLSAESEEQPVLLGLRSLVRVCVYTAEKQT